MELLKNKIAVITGGTQGIGLATAELFANQGATVIVGARREFEANNISINYEYLDVSDYSSCFTFFNDVIAKYGKVDILVNNAGIMHDRTTAKMSEDEFNSVINTNLKGTFNMTKLFGPHMQKNNNGSIINVSSCVAKFGNFGQANYVASKLGIEGMTKCWAKEFASHGENVRVNCVAPGIVKTDIFNNTPSEIVSSFKKRIALGRFADPKEIANCILFLASDLSSYVTGSVLSVDGGGIDFWINNK